MKYCDKNNVHSFVILLIGLFVISTFSNFFYQKILHLSFNTIEIVLIPTIIYGILKRKIIIPVKQSFRYIFFMIILLALGFLFLQQYYMDLFSTLRSYILFGIGFIILKYNNIICEKDTFKLCIIGIIGDIICHLLLINELVSIDDKEFTLDPNFILIFYAIPYSIFICKKKTAVLVFLLSIMSSYLSITRGMLLFTICTFILSYFTSFVFIHKKYKSRRLLNTFFVLLLLSSITYIFYIKMENTIENYSPSMHYRLYTKVNDKDNAVTGDADRINNISLMIENIDKYILPRGFVSRESGHFQSDTIIWSVRDSSLIEIIYTFGIFSIVLLIYFLNMIIILYRLSKKNHDLFASILFSSLIMLIPAIFLGYGLLISPPTILSLGALIGKASNKIKSYNNDKSTTFNRMCKPSRY